jgi:hypothetical protein
MNASCQASSLDVAAVVLFWTVVTGSIVLPPSSGRLNPDSSWNNWQERTCPLYANVVLVLVRATERDEGTDLLSKQREWVVRFGHLEDGENTPKPIYHPTQCEVSEEAYVFLSVLYNCIVKPDKKAESVLYRTSFRCVSEVQGVHFSCINSNDSSSILCMVGLFVFLWII